MAGFLLPLFGAGWQAFDNQGLPLAGGLLHTYQAGTVNTPLATYTDSGLGTPNPNPIVLDSTGRPPNEIWIADNPLKLVLTDKNGGAISNGTWDNVPGLNNVAVTVTEWVPSMLTPTYISTTQFSVPGNQTSIFSINRRLQYFLSGVPYYGYVSVASYDGFSTTTITIVPDATNLDNTLNIVSYGFLNSVNPSVPEQLLTAVASQTHVAGAKATLASLDEFPLADSASSFVIKKVTWAQILANIWTGFGALIAGGTAKTTPTGADTLPISDSAASGASKSLSFTNLLTYLTSALTPTNAINAINAINATNATNVTNAVNLTGSGTVSGTTTGGAGLTPHGVLLAYTEFTTSNATFAPNALTSKIVVCCIGGGGQGEYSGGLLLNFNGGGGGGAGQVVWGETETILSSYNVTVGAASGTSSFGSVASALGGQSVTGTINHPVGIGGRNGGIATGGSGIGTGTSGGVQIGSGGNGGTGTSSNPAGGGGGARPEISFISGAIAGNGGNAGINGGNGGNAAANSGAGGGGGGAPSANVSGATGGTGGTGIVVVWEYA